jgi:3-phosphoshikimate 1-carboxyvinyltransferase
MTRLSARASRDLTGRIAVPGDKSISHRALMLGGLAAGRSEVTGLLEGEDVLATAAAMAALGVGVERVDEGRWTVDGVGLGALAEPAQALDFGNAGTGVRLMMGVLAGHPMTVTLTGDASLSRRPMGRVMAPLSQMGAQFRASEGGRLPIVLTGRGDLLPIEYELPVPSAQVKSAVLLAGLSAPGETRVIERQATRDHTERMLAAFGADIVTEPKGEATVVTVVGQPELAARHVAVPGDPSSAAFPLVAALITEGSEITIEAVGANPLRTGLIATLEEMGADIALENPREVAGEPVADLRARASALKGVEVPAERAPSMIDEYPILAMAAALAEGRTVMRGLAELRVKESDRLSAVARGLAACGVEVEEGEDHLVVEGRPGGVMGGAEIAADLDHRIAMAFLVLGLAAKRPITIDDASPIATSFPAFESLMQGLGAQVEAAGVDRG